MDASAYPLSSRLSDHGLWPEEGETKSQLSPEAESLYTPEKYCKIKPTSQAQGLPRSQLSLNLKSCQQSEYLDTSKRQRPIFLFNHMFFLE
jgi:hypothetical protein